MSLNPNGFRKMNAALLGGLLRARGKPFIEHYHFSARYYYDLSRKFVRNDDNKRTIVTGVFVRYRVRGPLERRLKEKREFSTETEQSRYQEGRGKTARGRRIYRDRYAPPAPPAPRRERLLQTKI